MRKLADRSAARFLVWFSFALASGSSRAEDAFYRVQAVDLKLTEGKLPAASRSDFADMSWRAAVAWRPYAVLDGPGEVFFSSENAPLQDRRNQPAAELFTLTARGPAGNDLAGTLCFPNADLKGMTKVRFLIPASKATAEARPAFWTAKERRMQELLDQGVPGGAWFRHELRNAVVARTGKPPEPPREPGGLPGRRSGLNFQFDEATFDLFSGGRAISENLQLDRVLTGISKDERLVDVASIEGITIAEVDWKLHLKAAEPELDPLATCIPNDQHALLFRSFESMLRAFDEADAQLTPLLHAAQPRAEDARTNQRYKKQLCLEDTALARMLGPQVVASVGITGSDPYLPTGSDVAILFEAKQPAVLLSFLTSKHKAAHDQDAGVELKSVDVGGTKCQSARSSDRSISSYFIALDNVVVVANSLVQIERIVAANSKQATSLAALPEYKFFRQRYARSAADETGFLILTDAAIRRWCSARWRIGNARRVRAAAVLAELQATHLDELAKGKVQAGPLHSDWTGPELGKLQLTPAGVASETFGNLAFMTPIAELDLAKVTEGEAQAYGRWRQNYQSNWRAAFDPIAVQFTIRKDRLAADVTVMPLIAGSDYREMIELTGGVALPPDAGDRHAGALLHFAMALNVESRMFQQVDGFLRQPLAALKFSPLSWVGKSIAFWIDDDPIWKEIAAQKNPERYAQQRVSRLPLVLRVECKDPLRLTLFLSTLRAFVDQTAPGMSRWTTVQNDGQPYIKIEPARRGEFGTPEEFHLVYAATPEALLVSLSENALKQTLARGAAAAKAKAEGKPLATPPGGWIGDSLALDVSPAALQVSQVVFSQNYRAAMQTAAWSNLHILNEWRRLYPEIDAVDLHERLWNVRLMCPGNGKYVWNDDYKTYASTVFGHPGKPLDGPAAPPLLSTAKALRFGLTFEKDGLRAKAVLDRQ